MWLIDAMNVVGSRPDGWWRDRPAALRRLVDEVGRLGDPAEVFLEGRHFATDAPPGVRVRWAERRGRDAADDAIVARLGADGSNYVVVTSDGALAERARAVGARVEGARTFRRRLDAA